MTTGTLSSIDIACMILLMYIVTSCTTLSAVILFFVIVFIVFVCQNTKTTFSVINGGLAPCIMVLNIIIWLYYFSQGHVVL